MTLDASAIETMTKLDAEQRFNYLIKEVVSQQQVWILTDEHGCVMLNSEEEDCVPVWPSEILASVWATDEWQECTPEAISISKWHSHWTPGLEDDQLAIVVFPNQDEEGVIVYPDEFDAALMKEKKKQNR